MPPPSPSSSSSSLSSPLLVRLLDGAQHMTLNVLGHMLTMSCLVPALALALLPEHWKQTRLVGLISQLQWDAHDWLEEMELHRLSTRLHVAEAETPSKGTTPTSVPQSKVEERTSATLDLAAPATLVPMPSPSPTPSEDKQRPQQRRHGFPLLNTKHRPVSPGSLVAAAA
ncbi:uncharacterized protein PFL1_04100 [Pseudozyma flocculosa PF-1]|uniref:Uncharacterized protein n=1 Tax=Pseudozyma flocculosa PF-1 TaxID=1277687 RepID=A0A061H6L4_9BASI|nr:uncharacterized protein PFL1_04100 [Pseudozyma flocculosa PF-1]EPQ28273.1 hypothetical protein PFL1_04100 [Pseudozyma flocculosa PF-1]